jgi:Ran GTPase-activating protein (RanGAP) involved in mRNA processing and transport
MPTLETEFDYNNKIDELNTKLDMLIKKSETEVVIDIDSVNEENNENEENDNDDEEEKPTTGDTTTS